MADASIVQTPILSESEINKIYRAANESVYMSSGAGSKYSQIPLVLSKFDRLGYNILMPNQELCGFTFFTRPHLNLSTSNLRQVRTMQLYDTLDKNTYAYTIRCLLDPNFASSCTDTENDFIDYNNPFLVPFTNCFQSISGFPDPTIETETTEGGYFGEDLTFVKGSDELSRTYDLSVTFRDIPGAFIFATLLAWTTFMSKVARGQMVAYPWDIESNRLCYTISIYRFITDPSKRFITKWAKATGCFPRAVPIGDAFNISEGDWYVEGTKQYTVPFVANKIEYMDPAIFMDFNRLVNRYCPGTQDGSWTLAPTGANANFMGIPYIDTEGGRNQLVWMIDPDKGELNDPLDTTMDNYREKINAAIAAANTSSTAE